MATVDVDGVALGVEADDAALVLLVGGTTMLSWPDSLGARLLVGAAAEVARAMLALG